MMRGAGLALLVLSAVAVQAEGQAQASARVMLQGRVIARGGQSYPRVYFPGTVELIQAKAITAEPGAHLEGLDIRLVLIERAR